uniref:Cytochrome b n=1 Tax=Tigriopus japonicus TaxID=158387 RepID=Q8M6U7_TIGJA|nr:cytochrome b [Tigriopus japonicus]
MYKVHRFSGLVKIMRGLVVTLPSPINISAWWNFGSLLGVCLAVQILSGLFLSFHFSAHTELSFFSVIQSFGDVYNHWWVRALHANGASFFFIGLYAHIGRGLFYGSYIHKEVWGVGVVLLLLVMASAFLGYVLPWGQMSFWGATVITSLFSAIPVVGGDIVIWLWGGFSVDNATLTRFFGIHFLVPFVVAALVGIHLFFLHEKGSSNPLGVKSDFNKISFHHYYVLKDLLGASLFLLPLLGLVYFNPWLLGDPENFIEANPLVTPHHIQPEWYFLFAYAILRAVPNKLGGVVALVGAILILFYLPFSPRSSMQGFTFYPGSKMVFSVMISIFCLLTWAGAKPVEEPYVLASQVLSILYFSYFFVSGWVARLQDKSL